jgi:hypothetical protein
MQRACFCALRQVVVEKIRRLCVNIIFADAPPTQAQNGSAENA